LLNEDWKPLLYSVDVSSDFPLTDPWANFICIILVILRNWRTRETRRGNVTVPPQMQLKLSVSEEAVSDLSPLSTLNPDDLDHLAFAFIPIDDRGLSHIAGLTGLKVLWVEGPGVSDLGLEMLTNLTKLRELSLDGTSISDAGLVHLEKKTVLQELWLSGSGISDAGLIHLRTLTKLKNLNLSRTNIDGSGLVNLQATTALQSLSLGGTGLADPNLTHLRAFVGLQYLRVDAIITIHS
jgi:hypothetical protein